MPLIHLTTLIHAPQQRVFDLSRSIDLHKHSLKHTSERAVAGTISGLINLNETVTWKAKHLFRERTLQVKVTAMQPHASFIDEAIAGDLKLMKHEHYFKQVENGTIMIDLMNFESKFGWLGKVLDKIFMKKYLTKLLEQRNAVIKDYSESNKWKHLL
jgi:ligand-binding SRPBCC domain-containing protein